VNREQLIEKGALALVGRSVEQGWVAEDLEPVTSLGPQNVRDVMRDIVLEVLDAILPQVTTVAELEALRPEALLLPEQGGVTVRSRSLMARAYVEGGGTLTLIWQPGSGDPS